MGEGVDLEAAAWGPRDRDVAGALRTPMTPGVGGTGSSGADGRRTTLGSAEWAPRRGGGDRERPARTATCVHRAAGGNRRGARGMAPAICRTSRHHWTNGRLSGPEPMRPIAGRTPPPRSLRTVPAAAPPRPS